MLSDLELIVAALNIYGEIAIEGGFSGNEQDEGERALELAAEIEKEGIEINV